MAPLALASALVLAALAHGTVAEILQPADRIAGKALLEAPYSLEGAWRRLPSPDGDIASGDVTPKSGVELTAGAATDENFLPMAFDAICALPLPVSAVRTARTDSHRPDTSIASAAPQPAPLSFDVRDIDVDWPMLESWSRRPDESARHVVSTLVVGTLAKVAIKSVQVAATAASKTLPARSEPRDEPTAERRPRPKPVAAPTPASPAQSAAVMDTFGSVSREAP